MSNNSFHNGHIEAAMCSACALLAVHTRHDLGQIEFVLTSVSDTMFPEYQGSWRGRWTAYGASCRLGKSSNRKWSEGTMNNTALALKAIVVREAKKVLH